MADNTTFIRWLPFYAANGTIRSWLAAGLLNGLYLAVTAAPLLLLLVVVL